jgi:hypothetical protein
MAPDIDVKPARKPEHTIRLAESYTETAQRLAASTGKPLAEVLANACEIGIVELVERENKMDWWKLNKSKGEITALLDAIPPDKL